MTIAVASGKGGTGKTLVSTSLALLISRNTSVVLADLDVEEPNTHIFFPKPNEAHIEDSHREIPVWQGSCSGCRNCATMCNFGAIVTLPHKVLIVPELCHGCHLCADFCKENKLTMSPYMTGTISTWKLGNLSLVEGKLNIGEESGTRLIQSVHRKLSEQYTSMLRILDCPPGTSCHVIESLKPADYVILVTEPTVFGAHDLELALELCKSMGLPAGVVINRHGIATTDIESLCKTFKTPVIARIGHCQRLASAYAEGTHPLDHSEILRNGMHQVQDFLSDTIFRP
jgi:MinD superfamily P-loop ATPase